MSGMLSDEQVTAFINDPATIATHDEAVEVIDCLDAEIANIQSQVDMAVIEANARPLNEDRQSWLRRATYACAMRRNERHRVMQRDKEIRGTKGSAGNSAADKSAKREANLVKQQRLLEETTIRRIAKENSRTQLQIERERVAVRRRELESENLHARIRELESKLLMLSET